MNHPNLGYSVKITITGSLGDDKYQFSKIYHDVIGMTILSNVHTVLFDLAYGGTFGFHYTATDAVELERI